MKYGLKLSLFKSAGLILFLAVLQSGCVAAVPLLMATQAASLGFGVFAVTKTVQLSTGGSLEVVIGENQVPAKNEIVLADITSVSVWPGDEVQVFVADKLQKSKIFDVIVTPSKVGKAIRQANLETNIGTLTETEMLQAFQSVCRETDTGALVALKSFGMESHMNAWSFSRATLNYKGTVFVYSLDGNRIIYASAVELIIDLGGNTPNQHEINQKSAGVIADKLIALRKGPTASKQTVGDQ